MVLKYFGLEYSILCNSLELEIDIFVQWGFQLKNIYGILGVA